MTSSKKESEKKAKASVATAEKASASAAAAATAEKASTVAAAAAKPTAATAEKAEKAPASASPKKTAKKATSSAEKPAKRTTRTTKRAKGRSSNKDQQIVFDSTADRSTVAQQAKENPPILMALIENLSTEARRIRQFSAAAISVVSETAPEILVIHIPHIVDALYRPEAQTRWESLEVLTRIVSYDPKACDGALIGAEGSLYDEESGTARLAAVRFLCAYGALDAKRSAKVWPLLDEAIQCYHGDPEFQDMLISVIGFADGKISKDVRASLANRMGFDASNGKGVLKKRAVQIVEICKKA
ncbi:MAG: hypothetical protein LBL27_01750 [Coriobacteriales bacterium]|jgi:chemotaxis protein histidine kinase CheA|nr:hypothetical protein [Coriobacteriales bacterium]